MSSQTFPEWGVPRKHIAKTAGVGAGGGLSEAERTDGNGNEPIGALISVDTNPVTITVDGTTPAAGTGHNIAPADPPFFLPGSTAIRLLDWIRSGASDGTLQITLFY